MAEPGEKPGGDERARNESARDERAGDERAGNDAPGRSHLEDGTRVSAETARRLSCDGAVVRVDQGPDGSVLDVGRRTRTVPPALRRALEIRDRGCRFPGCGLRFADAHHVRHWADGGRTRLGNLVLLCRFHHRLVHEEGWRVLLGEGGRVPVFVDPRGGMHAEAPPRVDCGRESPAESPYARLLRENREHGADPDHRTAAARHKHARDVPVELYERALEAMEAERARARADPRPSDHEPAHREGDGAG